MNGIIFFKSKVSDKLKEFYVKQVGCSIWLEQEDCFVLNFGNMLFGFCARDQVDDCGIITFYYQSKNEVDKMFNKFSSIADNPPQYNPKYRIYHFFARDPEDRMIEFQWFEDKMKPIGKSNGR